MCFQIIIINAQTEDTLSIYKKIQRIAYKHKGTTLLYQEIFVDPAPRKYENTVLSYKKKEADPYLKYVGNIIRKVEIIVYDPFGYSVNDTTRGEINRGQKIGNKFHITSRHRIIRNLLLFKKNDKVEFLKIAESERILREARFINDARIYFEPIPDCTDSVDIKVVVKDRWTLDALISGSTTSGHITFRDRNIFGLGQKFEQFMSYNSRSGNYEFGGNYAIENIDHLYISSSLSYLITRDIRQTGVILDRPFYSVYSKWAGGISASKTWGIYKYVDSVDPFERRLPLELYNYDVWLAKSFNTGNRKTTTGINSNVVIALRYEKTHFQRRPSFIIDTNKVNVNSSLWLGSIGFSLRKYYKDQYIYRFGANEDVPEGLIVQSVHGLLYKEENKMRYYSGFEISEGKHFEKIGYLSGSFTYGTFYKKSIFENAAINAGVYYFSNLFENHKWYFRQFVDFKLIYGIDKVDKITLRSDEMYGFNSGTLTGSSKMILNLEAVTYAPYNIIGFRFAPLILVGFGMLETDKIKLLESKVYQAYSVGFLIRNENLLNSSFKITAGFYPNLPDGNKNFSKINPSINFTLKVGSFAISKPSIVVYE